MALSVIGNPGEPDTPEYAEIRWRDDEIVTECVRDIEVPRPKRFIDQPIGAVSRADAH